LIELYTGEEFDSNLSLEQMRNKWEDIVNKIDLDNVSSDILNIEDKYLRTELINRKLTDSERLKTIKEILNIDSKYSNKICLWQGEITSIYTDVIVNPTKVDNILVKGKLDYDIFFRSGLRLRKKFKELVNNCQLDNADVLITRAYNIPCDYIIHVIIPDIEDKLQEEDKISIKMAYLNVLECANNNLAKIVVVPILGGKYNKELAIIEIQAIKEYLDRKSTIEKIVICVNNKNEYDKFVKLLRDDLDA